MYLVLTRNLFKWQKKKKKIERISQNKQESNCKMASKNPGLKIKKKI